VLDTIIKRKFSLGEMQFFLQKYIFL